MMPMKTTGGGSREEAQAKIAAAKEREFSFWHTSLEHCPICGSEVYFGFGFYGGGYGGYRLCLSDACDWMEKDEEEVE
jgi:hypothetical protein